MKSRFEKLVEYIINQDEAKASKLFHEIVVESSRDIYESLQEEVSDNQVEDLANDVENEEHGAMYEDEDELAGDDEFVADDDEFDPEYEDTEAPDEEAVEDRVASLEAALDELQAEFDALMSQEEQEPEHHDGFDADEFTQGDSDFDAVDAEDVDDQLNEYVEKVADQGQKAEGKEIGKGGRSVSVNKSNPLAGKNDFGGTAKNIAQGKAGNNPNGQTPTKANNYGTKGQGNINSGNINVPGGKAGSAFKTKQTAKSGEGQTTDGKVKVNTKSELGSR